MFLNILFILFYFVCRPLTFELHNTEHLQLITFDTTEESLIAFNFASQVEASRFREKILENLDSNIATIFLNILTICKFLIFY
jgi:hypothetical protein